MMVYMAVLKNWMTVISGSESFPLTGQRVFWGYVEINGTGWDDRITKDTYL
jgi:hypothetical protein